MNSPDQLAADYDPDEITGTAGDLTEDHVGAVVSLGGDIVTLVAVSPVGATHVELITRRDGEDFDRSLSVLAAQPYRLVTPPPGDGIELIDPEEVRARARELDGISARIRQLDIELPELRRRKAELSDALLADLAMMGEKSVAFTNGSDRRRAYVYPVLIPVYRQKDETGARYTPRDLAPVLRSLGEHDAVKPEEAGHNALLRIFRRYISAEKPLPPELAEMVRHEIVHEVRVGVGGAD